jgi:hypothetical protein
MMSVLDAASMDQVCGGGGAAGNLCNPEGGGGGVLAAGVHCSARYMASVRCILACVTHLDPLCKALILSSTDVLVIKPSRDTLPAGVLVRRNTSI